VRLTRDHIDAILEEVDRVLGPGASIWLYGSRLQDHLRGGDVDLMLDVAEKPSMRDLAVLRDRLEERLGLPCDLLVRVRSESPTAFMQMVAAQAVRLEAAA